MYGDVRQSRIIFLGVEMDKDDRKRDGVTVTETLAERADRLVAEAVEENKKLTPRRRDFCRYYVKNKNATQAYLRAYGCLRGAATTNGHRLLQIPLVKAEVRRLQEIRNAVLETDANDVIALHMRIAFSDITDFVEFDNNKVRLRPSNMIDGNIVTEVMEKRDGVKIKLVDRQKSLAFLERYFELNPMDRHRKDYDNRRIAIDEKAEIDEKTLLDRRYIAASLSLWEYCKLKAPDFYTDDVLYLREMCQALQEFEYDDNELLVLNIPPRHGKTRTVSLAAQWYLGREASLKMIVAGYNEKLSRQISKTVRDAIGEVKADEDIAVFSDVFPGVRLKDGAAMADLWQLDNSTTSNYLASSPKASLTGFGADVVFVDDIVRDAYAANHRGILEEHFAWFTDTLYSRLEGRRKVIISATRWATKDLAGRVIEMYESQGRKIRVITKKAFDGQKMLNEKILGRLAYDSLIKTVGEDIVRANYDQEPIDLKGRLYGQFVTYEEKPHFAKIAAVCDIADEGSDFLCNIIYGVCSDKAYVLDVYYTQDAMDATEHELARRLIDFAVDECEFESNFGGKAFAKNIEREYRAQGGAGCRFRTYTQRLNKEARILSSSTNVTRQIFMPEYWAKMFPRFYCDVVEYQRVGKNAFDDAPDTLSRISEKLNQRGFVTGQV